MTKEYPIYLAGSWVTSDERIDITNPYTGDIVGTTYLASVAQVEEAIVAAESAFQVMKSTPVYDRVAVLNGLARKMREHRDAIARMITLEAGKPIRDAEVEADRGVFTVETAAEEAKRISGEVMPLDLLPSSKGRFGITRRFPVGPVSGISPFNFPLNLALHKLAPALAAGCPIVLKPASRDPLVMLMIAEMLDGLGLPEGAVSILPMNREVGDILVEDDRFKLLSFTGSPDVGWAMKTRAGRKKVVLELGGNAGVVVDNDADLDFAAQRVRVGAFAYAGQVCISVQRVFVHEDVYDTFKERLIAETKKIVYGDPLDRATDLGPMIDDKAAARSEGWIRDAVQAGATVLTGGVAEGRFMQPTIIENAAKEAFVCSREAFAPLVTLFPVKSFKEGIESVNDSVYGLQAGIFTNNLERALYAFEHVEAGGVVLNDIPTYRIDHMPYGGVKDSGLSREGLRYAIEDMTEMRLLVVNRLESQRVM
ncbi:MAG: aldehyde dehydrogenase family protein [Thermomicrobiales bacterium]|nr:aldehyde dehydrogenase family protein [Thermomicrobiales bacterium]